ncbi:hypothetical protein TSUD_65030 [Trifolium subterraneum]|uniref:F-box domain-containing protein n=1 Tax=Trifolium subterraneum TaxID=3900 RepID=A0A2Z6MCE1_TRISU|nr:hypothetical protein TSUD_65030 [Trifolium subterraneum]
MKRRRQCENENEKNDGNEDRLSDLPDYILLHILSFLNTEDVVQTCVLSTRWKHLWKHISTLMLHASGFYTVKHFATFVSKILTLRASTTLHSLDLKRHGHIEPQLLKNILKYICSHTTHLRELRISVRGDSDLIMRCVSQCQALTSLKLSIYPRGNSHINFKTLFPKSLNLPALTNLDLKNFIFCGDENECVEPFSAFTNLKSLVIRRWMIKDAQILSISSETLVNFALHHNSLSFSKIELSTPSLCTLTFPGDIIQKTCGSLSSIKQVNINSEDFSYPPVDPLVILSWLQDLSNIESLKVTSTTLQILFLVPDLLEIKLRSLCNLKSLEVELIPDRFLVMMQEDMLKKAAAKSRKEAAKLRNEFKTGRLKLSPIPDGIVDFLQQNSPSAKVNITTQYPDCFNLKQIEESIKGAKSASSSTAAESASAAAPDSAAVAPPNFNLCCVKKDEASSNEDMVEMPRPNTNSPLQDNWV